MARKTIRKNLPVKKTDIGKIVTYVGKTSETGNRIVYYIGTIIGETDTTYDIRFQDQYIFSDEKEPFVKYNVPKSKVVIDNNVGY